MGSPETSRIAARGRGRSLAAALAVGTLAVGLMVLGGWWLDRIPFERVWLQGHRHATEAELVALARVDTGMTLFSIDPLGVADRLERHPWVREARATRLPTGVLSIRVAERVPVALVVDRAGRMSHYLDRAGVQMPLRAEAVYNVPLVRGVREPHRPGRIVRDPVLRELLAALAGANAQTEALLSEFVLEEAAGVVLHTLPARPGERAIPVQLGRDGFEAKLDLLSAFWQQAVLVQHETRFERIDLRFKGQVVTEAKSLEPDSVGFRL